MALLNLDTNTLDLSMRVGVLESYSPSQEMKELVDKIENLKNNVKYKARQIIGEVVSQKEAVEILKKDANKNNEWQKFLNESYGAELSNLIETVAAINKSLCPGYEEHVAKRA